MAKNGLTRMLKIGTLALAIGVGAGCTGCEQTAEKKPEIFDIKISEHTVVGSFYIEYNGMNNEKTFSISSHTDHAVNTYYPADSKEIHYQGMGFKVNEVTPEHIVLER